MNPPSIPTAPSPGPASPASPRRPVASRLLRSGSIIVLVLAFTLIATLGYIGLAYAALATYFHDAKEPPGAALSALGLCVALLPLILTLWAARRRWLRGPILATAGAVAGAILAWLAWDDGALRHPLTIDEVAPAFDGAERSYAVLMEYSKQHPTDEAKAFANYHHQIQFTVGGAKEPAKWSEFITQNRAALEADWVAGAPQRAWLNRLNAFDRIGDLTPATYDADIPSFQVWRFLAQRSCAIASLQALDGDGDAALATLLPMIEAGRKFETSSRTLVRLMIARVVQRMGYETAGFILDRTQPSTESRARLHAAVADGNSAAGARRMVQVEYAFFTPMLGQVGLSDTAPLGWGSHRSVPRALNFLTPFVINPRATANLYGDQVRELAALAEARDLGGFVARQQAFYQAHLHAGMKNLGGRLLISMATPAYQKVLKSYWEIEDLRVALAARVRSPSS